MSKMFEHFGVIVYFSFLVKTFAAKQRAPTPQHSMVLAYPGLRRNRSISETVRAQFCSSRAICLRPALVRS